ncbi:DUF2232 domain-containing protein [Bacillaceae bacterium SIJ1]|uniref:YybS family protein n=1 Tax=Litoribacterium kuwaitense TaxID=1398745 RepID=UPI0013E9C78B|nr:DUF2232 domain-containing protein [Litoribacterium kuwaitense]NGP45214.1 DUF2232 domain-containing protein [Litoribacterium kuwaitense]
MNASNQLFGIKQVLFFLILLAGAMLFPTFFFIIALIMPLPFALYTARYGVRAGVVLGVIMLLVSTILSGLGPLIVLPAALAGVGIAYFVSKKKSPFAIWSYSSLVYLATFLGGLVMLYTVFQFDMDAFYEESLQEALAMSQTVFQSFGEDYIEEQAAVIRSSMAQLRALMPTFLVGLSVLAGLITTWITLRAMKKGGDLIPEPWKPFRQWQVPKSYAIFYLLLSIVMMFTSAESAMAVVFLNVFSVLLILMTVQGFTFIFYFCHHKKYATIVPVLVTIVSLVIPFIALFLVRFLGVFDLVFQLRSRMEAGK